MAEDTEEELAAAQAALDFKNWVRGQRCLLAGVSGAGPCRGQIDPDHLGTMAHHDRGTGLRPSDLTCAPMCRGHHEDRHASIGYFDPDRMPKAEAIKWRLAAIARTQMAYTRWRMSTPMIPF